MLSKGKVFRCSTEVGKRGSSANRFLIQFRDPGKSDRTGASAAHTPKPGFQKGSGLAAGVEGWQLLCICNLEVREYRGLDGAYHPPWT